MARVSYLTKHKDAITSIGAIFTALGVITALGFSAYNIVAKPKKAILDIMTTKMDQNRERVIIYNGGDGPCVEMFIKYQNKFFVQQIVNYDTSWPTNSMLDEKGQLVSTPRVFTKTGVCHNQNCFIDAGVLKPNSIYALEFSRNQNTQTSNEQITITCINTEKKIQIF